MAHFRFETEVMVFRTLEYHIEADSVEEARGQLLQGYRRDEGIVVNDDTDWVSEEISAEEELSK
jgi:hypothetical protein